MRKVLNVGGNSKAIALPPHFADYEHILLDIDPSGNPDIVCDARSLNTIEADQFDAIYCSHNLEHYYHHDVKKVLSGFRHVLKPNGFVQIRVPDLMAVMQACIDKSLDLDSVLYQSSIGPISPLDVIYGYGEQIASSGQEFFAHKTGFSLRTLMIELQNAGFVNIHRVEDAVQTLELNLVGFKVQ